MVDEAAAVGVAHALLYRRDLPLVQLDELPHRFGGKRGAAPIRGFGQLVEAFPDAGIQSQRDGFASSRLPVYNEYIVGSRRRVCQSATRTLQFIA